MRYGQFGNGLVPMSNPKWTAEKDVNETGPSRMESYVHSRINTSRVQPGQIDELVASVRSLLPRSLQQSPGLKSVLLLGNRQTGKLVIVSLWESEAAAEPAEPVYQEAMREVGRFLAEPVTRERCKLLQEERM